MRRARQREQMFHRSAPLLFGDLGGPERGFELLDASLSLVFRQLASGFQDFIQSLHGVTFLAKVYRA